MARLRGGTLLTLGLLVASTGATVNARAEGVADSTRAAARSLGAAGVSAYQAGDYANASDKLERAYHLLQVPSLGLWSARALEKLGKLVEAGERYTEVTRLVILGGDAAVQTKAQNDARAEHDALDPRIPTLTIQAKGANASQVTVTLDGQPLPSVLIGETQPIDPGAHRVEGTVGAQHVQSELTIAVGENARAVLRFDTKVVAAEAQTTAPAAAASTETRAPEPNTEKRPLPLGTLGWVGIGVGGAGLVFGGITGLLALGKHSDIEQSPNCSGNHCLSDEKSTVNSYNSLRTLSSIGFIGGGVLAATGIVLLLNASSSNAPSTALLMLEPNGASLRGQF